MRHRSLVALAVLILAMSLPVVAWADAPAEKQAKVLMLGDSITKYGMPEAVAAPLNELTKGRVAWTLVNAGVGGETAEVGKTRLATLLQTEKPDVLTISYGLNDLARNCKPEDFRAHFVEMIDLVAKQRPTTRVILFTATPFDPRHSLSKSKNITDQGGADLVLELKFNALVRQLAAEKNLPLIDLHRYVLTDPEWSKYLKPDGVHFTPEGYTFCAKHVAAALAAWYQTEAARDPKAVKSRDDCLAQLKTLAATATQGANRPEVRSKLLAALDVAWRVCPYLPQQAAIWHAVRYSGKNAEPAKAAPAPPASPPDPSDSAGKKTP